jgi:salicylate hydroxylase
MHGPCQRQSHHKGAADRADGLRSTVRAQMLGEGEPHTIGYVAHRTIVPMKDVRTDVHRNEVVLWSGPGFHIVHYPLRQGELFNIVAVFRTSTYAEKGDAAAYRAELNRTYRDSHPAMKSLLALLDLERRWVISDRDPIRNGATGALLLVLRTDLAVVGTGGAGGQDAVCLAN